MRFSDLTALLACLGFVSCVPVGSYPGVGGEGGLSRGGSSAAGGGASGEGISTTERPSASDQQELRQLREAQGNSEGGRYSPGSGAGSTSVGGGEFELPPLPPLSPLTPRINTYRYAVPVPGRKGWVYNPYTNTTVDARGVESGRLIYDETDPANRQEDGTLKPVEEMPHKFRVP